MNKSILPFLVLAIMIVRQNTTSAQGKDMLVRISEIEIVPENLEDYKAILIEEANASVHLEKGVISIFPMFQRRIQIISGFWKSTRQRCLWIAYQVAAFPEVQNHNA